MSEDLEKRLREYERELANFQSITRYLIPHPGEIPKIQGIDIYGETIPLKGFGGGDHIIYVDFNKRFDLPARIREAEKHGMYHVAQNLRERSRVAGIVLMDAAGHSITDASITAQFHQAFLLGILYELEKHGRPTRELFEKINTRFYNSSSVTKY